jgi:hypothetical protein
MRTRLPLLVLLTACSAGPSAGFPPDTDRPSYSYTALSPTGEPILVGRIELAFLDDSIVTGTWTIAWIAGADTTLEVGPQVGSGTLAGSRSGGLLLLNLNPSYADNNVGLRAIPSKGGYEGVWGWDAFNGPRTSGTFTATRQ